MAEEFAFQQVLRQGGAVHRHKGTAVAAAFFMDEFGKEFLARAAFPLDENGGAGIGHPFHQPHEPLHAGISGDDGHLGFGLGRGCRGRGFGVRGGGGKHPSGTEFQLPGIHRFHQILHGPLLHQRQGIFHMGFRADENHPGVGQALVALVQKRQGIESGGGIVGHHQIGFHLTDLIQGGIPVGDGIHLEPHSLKQLHKGHAFLGIFQNDK